ncbi:MAG TPA: phosphate ABC transporter permease PstA [Methanotrichaceae archaeon]|nr:phosphate ABC transporter permease PstA [Methanotrichaceae archaeon]HQF17724.1 phosphate ABC transporter permease PstA [Methanotrichaceae archaeon]HQI92339.1 phosphate ABC transporter permease PstA [Methanotrichaceae archaeon]HQJ29418.1 phosphate ABC transporter permease PstA [Methanotrichaceae archaeon]
MAMGPAQGMKPLPAITLIVSGLLLVSSVLALLVQPDLARLAPTWAVAILLCAGAAALSFVFSADKKRTLRQSLYAGLDILLSLLVSYSLLSGLISPETSIRPEGLGASFGHQLISPVLVLVISVLLAKDGINSAYGYGQKGRQVLVFSAVRLSAILALLILGGILFVIVSQGIWAINWEVLTAPHRRLGQEGGIYTCIEGTFWLVMGAMLVSAPLGIGAAIYLQEYSRQPRLNRLITVAVSCLNGVPSVVFGLFGLAFLVSTVGISLLAGSIVLGLMNLPTIILTSQEALKSVPNSLREGSVALGATKWQTVKRIVLPSALPGVLTGLIIGVAKAAGETAPVMWTAVTFTATPVHKFYGVVPDVYQPVNNLCYHLLQLIYFLGAWDVEEKAWGTALVLMALVLCINMLAILVRNYYMKKISW